MNVSELPDSALLQHYRSHHSEAEFAELIRRHKGLVLGVTRRILGNQADAEDAGQAVFVALAIKPPRLRTGQTLAPWLHLVAVRAACDLRKMSARRMVRDAQAIENCHAAPSPWTALIDSELEKLPRKLSATLIAHYFEGWSVKDLARREGCAPSTITMRLSRGRNQLRSRLRSDLSGEAVASLAAVPLGIGQIPGFGEATLKVVSQSLAGLRITTPAAVDVIRLARLSLRPNPRELAFPSFIAASAAAALAISFMALNPSPASSSNPIPNKETLVQQPSEDRGGSLTGLTPEAKALRAKMVSAQEGMLGAIQTLQFHSEAKSSNGGKGFSKFDYATNGTLFRFRINQQPKPESGLPARLVEVAYDARSRQSFEDRQLAIKQLPSLGQTNAKTMRSPSASDIKGTTCALATANNGFLLPFYFLFFIDKKASTFLPSLQAPSLWEQFSEKAEKIEAINLNGKDGLHFIMKVSEGIFGTDIPMRFEVDTLRDYGYLPVAWKFTDKKGNGWYYSVSEISSSSPKTGGKTIYYPRKANWTERYKEGSIVNDYEIVVSDLNLNEKIDEKTFTIDPAKADNIWDADKKVLIPVPR